jgi:hypothetical protein
VGCTLALLALGAGLTPPTAHAREISAGTSAANNQRSLAPTNFPAVDPDYIYDQLFTMATRFLHREAGFDTNLPPDVNGHDEFAAYWAQEMQRDLQGFGATVRRDPFTTPGWRDRPAVTQAFNVEVTVPGLTHPDQVVVIGCHYDGEAVSTQSANDDGSGCAIELGVAKALAEYWRAHKVYPARTLRFVLFDAEEQGIYGSFHYVNATVNGDLGNIVAMINEEQNGIAYPLRFLGQASNPLLPFITYVSPLSDNDAYPAQHQLSAQQRASITQFSARAAQAVPAAFAQFRALGYSSLVYRDASNAPVTLPIFSDDQMSTLQQREDDLAASDEYPFTLAGLPAATFIGNFSYYPEYGGNNPPPWSYPFDQPNDTIQLMNTYANGTPQKAPSLALALALPGMLSTELLSQPDVLGQAPADGLPLAAVGDIGLAQPGKDMAFDATASFDPSGKGPLSYTWSFGDGATASGISVSHAYRAPGAYTLRLTVSSPAGARQTATTVLVTATPPVIAPPFQFGLLSGRPPPNPKISIPTPSDNQSSAATKTGVGGLPLALLVGLPVTLLLLPIAVGTLLLMRRRARVWREAATTVPDAGRPERVEALQALAREQLGREAPRASRSSSPTLPPPAQRTSGGTKGE